MNDALVIEVVRKSVTVDCAVEEAFRIFTADATSWWPVEGHSLQGPEVREVVFEPKVGGTIYEIAGSGERGHWATVLEWEVTPGVVGTEVEVRFQAEDDGTRVELEHRGWENAVAGAIEKRDSYDTGWEYVLGKYGERI
jgi:hypothetical protein